MRDASTNLIAVTAIGTLVAMIPCLGWLNWFTVPISAACCIVGVVGMLTDRDPETQEQRDVGLHVGAIVVGITAASLGGFRCLMGGFVV